ncbi:hypothetical protein [Streptodolium elevatio]|uniref:Uncharacterized protein n=1 Tax=Streptodolium elevatio TaxID=3157996 RepID=A0ABV3DR67_9ACTN
MHQRLLPAADRLLGGDAAAVERAFSGRGAVYAGLLLGLAAIGVRPGRLSRRPSPRT